MAMLIARITTLILLQLALANAGKILLLPYPFPSHVAFLANIGEGLRDNGHSLYIGITGLYDKMDGLKKQNITIIEHTNPKETWLTMEGDMDKYLEQSIEHLMIDELRDNMPGSFEICENMLEDKDFISRLHKEAFDLVIIDAFQFSRCFYIIPYLLDVPWVSAYTIYEPWLSRNPSLPSVFPFILSQPYTEKMTFWERLNNLRAMVDFTVRPGSKEMDENLVSKYAPGKPLVTLNTLAGRSKLWLLARDTVLDYARPLMPNEILVGGLSTKPPKPLAADLESFVSSAKDGVIVVSFGSIAANLPHRIQNVLIDTFKKLKQLIIWRYPHSPPENLPKNIKLMSWLPQNDLLGHKNVRLFITHCGANGQFEALYNGVPMIGLPMFGEQMYNAKRMDYLGYGIHLSLLTFTEESLLKAINEILYNPAYTYRIGKASEIFRNQPMNPKQKATYWVEHVLKYGGEHLRSYALDMPWYQYLMLDILAFLLVVIAISFSLLITCSRRLFCKSTSKAKKD